MLNGLLDKYVLRQANTPVPGPIADIQHSVGVDEFTDDLAALLNQEDIKFDRCDVDGSCQGTE